MPPNVYEEGKWDELFGVEGLGVSRLNNYSALNRPVFLSTRTNR